MFTFDGIGPGIGPRRQFILGEKRGQMDQWERVASDRDPLVGHDWTGLGDYRASSPSTGGNGEHDSGHYKTTNYYYYYHYSSPPLFLQLPSSSSYGHSDASDNSSPCSLRLSLRSTLAQETQIISSRLSRRRLPPRMLRRRRPR